jgi:hypothetical protein
MSSSSSSLLHFSKTHIIQYTPYYCCSRQNKITESNYTCTPATGSQLKLVLVLWLLSTTINFAVSTFSSHFFFVFHRKEKRTEIFHAFFFFRDKSWKSIRHEMFENYIHCPYCFLTSILSSRLLEIRTGSLPSPRSSFSFQEQMRLFNHQQSEQQASSWLFGSPLFSQPFNTELPFFPPF